jgi:hypothetical protein
VVLNSSAVGQKEGQKSRSKGRLEPHDITSHCAYTESCQCSGPRLRRKRGDQDMPDLARRCQVDVVADQNHRISSEFRPVYTYIPSPLLSSIKLYQPADNQDAGILCQKNPVAVSLPTPGLDKSPNPNDRRISIQSDDILCHGQRNHNTHGIQRQSYRYE